MRQSLAIAFACALVGGCSLIYNPNDLGQPADAKVFRDASVIDAPIDAPLVRDADPSMLVLTDIEPNVIYGGQGSGQSPPATLVISGHNFIDNFSIDIEPSTGLHVIGTPMRSFDGNYIALQVEADVISGSGSQVPLTISVSEPNAPTQMISATLSNLPTLETTSLDYDTLTATTYARIAIPAGTLTFTGTPAPILLRSISSVTIGAPITATGAAASGVNAGAAGPGGCAGGGLGIAGGCMVGGGGGASNTDGGGGGGFANVGGNGGGETNGGAMHGNAAILNYAADGTHSANQSAGGGGGAGGSLLSGKGGGGGGGGGGTVEIDAGGSIALASVDVSGGNGGNGSGGLTSTTGGGGGGAGGVLVIRSAAGDLTVSGMIAANGGMGGTGGTSLGATGGHGGPGSLGRVRADVPSLPVVPSTTAHRNPIFDVATQTISPAATAPITLHGTAGEMFDLTDYDFMNVDHDGEPKNVMFDPSGMATPTVSLRAGYNRLCATLHDGMPGAPLADTCIVLVYLP
jgi:hypothetical protein